MDVSGPCSREAVVWSNLEDEISSWELHLEDLCNYFPEELDSVPDSAWNLLSRWSCLLGLLSRGHNSSLTGNIPYWNCVSCISSFYERLKPQSCSVLIPAAEVHVRCDLTNKLHIIQSPQPGHLRLMKIS